MFFYAAGFKYYISSYFYFQFSSIVKEIIITLSVHTLVCFAEVGVCVCVCVLPPILSVREASMVLNCCILVCMRLARLQRMAGIVWAFLSEENSLDTHAS